jgi:hypothetical protein
MKGEYMDRYPAPSRPRLQYANVAETVRERAAFSSLRNLFRMKPIWETCA